MQPSDNTSPFLRKVREAIRVRHLSIRTEEAYVGWIKRFIVFHGKRHPMELGEAEVAAFLTHLAVQGHVAASTQNQGLNALVFSTPTYSTVRWGIARASYGLNVRNGCQSCSRPPKWQPCSASYVASTG